MPPADPIVTCACAGVLGSLPAADFGAPLFAKLLARQPSRLLTTTLVLADLHAVGRQRTLDEEPVAREPLILAREAVDPLPVERGHVHRLALFEHVLLQLLPVVVALEQHAPHQRIEVRLRGGTAPARPINTHPMPAKSSNHCSL